MDFKLVKKCKKYLENVKTKQNKTKQNKTKQNKSNVQIYSCFFSFLFSLFSFLFSLFSFLFSF